MLLVFKDLKGKGTSSEAWSLNIGGWAMGKYHF